MNFNPTQWIPPICVSHSRSTVPAGTSGKDKKVKHGQLSKFTPGGWTCRWKMLQQMLTVGPAKIESIGPWDPIGPSGQKLFAELAVCFSMFRNVFFWGGKHRQTLDLSRSLPSLPQVHLKMRWNWDGSFTTSGFAKPEGWHPLTLDFDGLFAFYCARPFNMLFFLVCQVSDVLHVLDVLTMFCFQDHTTWWADLKLKKCPMESHGWLDHVGSQRVPSPIRHPYSHGCSPKTLDALGKIMEKSIVRNGGW